MRIFDDEPQVAILHLNRYDELEELLRPYEGLITLSDDTVNLISRLNAANQSFVVIGMLPEHTSEQYNNFQRIDFQRYTSVTYIYSLYRENPVYVRAKFNRYRQQLRERRSITDDTLREVLFICFGNLNSHMSYCKERAQCSMDDGDVTVAKIYLEEWQKRCQLQQEANKQLLELI